MKQGGRTKRGELDRLVDSLQHKRKQVGKLTPAKRKGTKANKRKRGRDALKKTPTKPKASSKGKRKRREQKAKEKARKSSSRRKSSSNRRATKRAKHVDDNESTHSYSLRSRSSKKSDYDREVISDVEMTSPARPRRKSTPKRRTTTSSRSGRGAQKRPKSRNSGYGRSRSRQSRQSSVERSRSGRLTPKKMGISRYTTDDRAARRANRDQNRLGDAGPRQRVPIRTIQIVEEVEADGNEPPQPRRRANREPAQIGFEFRLVILI